MRWLVLTVSHLLVAAAGFVAGIFLLPILTAQPPSSAEDIEQVAQDAVFHGEFRRDLAGSDFLHWGEGRVSVTTEAVALKGKIAPGPDYALYFSPRFVESKEDFLAAESEMVRVGAVKQFENFLVPLPASVDPADFNTVVVWCEGFGQFITAALYRE